MKKFLLSILTIMYMTVSSGIAMELHYCMGEKAGVEFYKFSNDKCSRCGMKEEAKKGCCHDEQQFYKLNDSHQKAVNHYNFNIDDIAVMQHFPVFNWQLPAVTTKGISANHSPPGFVEPPARILHGVFRI